MELSAEADQLWEKCWVKGSLKKKLWYGEENSRKTNFNCPEYVIIDVLYVDSKFSLVLSFLSK